MTRGYTRAEASRVGDGAADCWSALLADRSPLDGSPHPVVGEVRNVYDRSAYLELALGEAADWPTAVPPLVLLCGEGIAGPLATQLRLPRGDRFRGADLTAGAACRMHRASGSPGSEQPIVVAIGKAFEIELDPAILTARDHPTEALGDITTIRVGGDRWSRGNDVLDRLEREDYADGLGCRPMLRKAIARGELSAPWESLVETWSAVPDVGAPTNLDGPWMRLLGRGPGATPSGDDVLAGMLLVLVRGTTGEVHATVRSAADALVGRAADRTTAISTALLAQAARGRSDPAIERCLRLLLAPDRDGEAIESAVDDLASIGHTSGIDTLVGMLVGILLIAPNVAPST